MMLGSPRTQPVRRLLPSKPESQATRYVLIAIATVTIVGAYPAILWYRVSDMQERWEVEDEARRNRKSSFEGIQEQFLRQDEARRWIQAESRRNQARRDLSPGTRPPGECAACEGLGLIKANPPPEKGKAAPGILTCDKCGGAGVTTKP